MNNNVEPEFNPIKEVVGGKKAERVIWSTNVINVALKAIEEGKPLKASPFYMKNTKLLRPELVYKRTKEEVEDYIKCKTDPVYFASKCYLMTPEGLQACHLRDYQIDYLHHLQNHRFSVFLSCRQSGKCNLLVTNQLYKIVKPKVKEENNFYFQIDALLKKYYYYINDNFIYITLPMFEIYNLYCKQTLIWKCKYHLYKIIYKLTYGRKKRTKNNKEA